MGISAKSSGADVGDIKANANAAIPAGWLACGGQAVSRATYSALFLAIGTLYGAGDGATTFNVPDLRGRTIFGKDNLGGTAANRLTTANGGLDGVTLGAVGGGESVTLTSAEMPSHTHIQNAHSHLEQAGNGAGGGISYMSLVSTANQTGLYTYANTPTAVSTATNQNTGTGGAHKNIPPAMVTNFIIKA